MGIFNFNTMFNLKDIIVDVKEEVPEEWVYKNYLGLVNRNVNEPFDGRLIRIRSPWSSDTTPSFYMFFKDGNYLWKDFSTGLGGNCYSLAQRITHTSYPELMNRIKTDAYEYIQKIGRLDDYKREIKERKKKKFDINITRWDDVAQQTWSDFKITARTIYKRKIHVISHYEIFENDIPIIKIHPQNSYAFSCNTGIYKIYNPEKTPKYITVDSTYITGIEQLTYTKDILLLQSGLKDICAMDELELELESIAGNSETTMLQPDLIRYLRTKFKFILTLFDNDKAGNNMSALYEKRYNTIPIYTGMEKDVALDLKNNVNIRSLREKYSYLINQKIQ